MDVKHVILDAGPLIAALSRREQHHEWAKFQFGRFHPPLITCESVISEACFVLKHIPNAVEKAMGMLSGGVVALPFRLSDEAQHVAALIRKYDNMRMSLADACLVRMSEQLAQSVVLTLDGDFRIYRKSNRQVIPLIMPG